MTYPNDPTNGPTGDNGVNGNSSGNNGFNSDNNNANNQGGNPFGSGPNDSQYGSGSTSYGSSSYGNNSGNQGSSSYGNSYGSSYGSQDNSSQYPTYGQSSDQTGQSNQSSGQNFGQYGQSSQYGQSGQYGQTPNEPSFGQTYSQQDQYGQPGQQPYAGYGPGYVNPDTQSESGKPLVVTGGPLPIGEPIPFGFKRLFTSQWHVYIGLMIIPFIVAMVVTFAFFLPIAIAASNDPYYEPGAGFVATAFILALILFLVMVAFSIVTNKVALKDTEGVKPTWENAFKNVPWGQSFLAYILVGLAAAVVFGLLFFLSIWLMTVVAPVGVILLLLTGVALFLASPFLTFIPLYAIDGKASATGAFSAAINDIKPQYWRVLGAVLLLGIAVAAVNFITGGFAGIITAPVQVLGTVFIYRWISGGSQQPQQQQPDGYMSMY